MFLRNKVLFRWWISPALFFAVLIVGITWAYLPQQPTLPQNNEIAVFVAGDALITRTWSEFNEPEFLGLINEIRGADVAVLNLEMLIHTFKGYPEKYDGQGTPMSAEPIIARELKWAGIDMVANANNHTNDYGIFGVLETKVFIEQAGIAYAGAGEDLQHARTPAYYKSRAGTVALLSTATTFSAFGVANNSRPDVHGRPGLNPLAITQAFTIPKTAAEKLYATARENGVPATAPTDSSFNMFGRRFTISNTYSSSYTVNQKDLAENLTAVREARNKATIVIMSVHCHESSQNMPPNFLIEFAHKCIDNGADIVFSHGPHYIRGIEIYNGKPIFYSLGNLVFQSETVKKIPADYFSINGYGDETTPEELQSKTRDSWNRQRQYWESVAAVVYFKDGALDRIRLIPITLGAGLPGTQGVQLPFGIRGRPLLAGPELGQYLIDKMIGLSQPFGTKIIYDKEKNIGLITF
jgi:poly-gamma-glutamate synthesis protein (capsule biosynthesis protein)